MIKQQIELYPTLQNQQFKSSHTTNSSKIFTAEASTADNLQLEICNL